LSANKRYLILESKGFKEDPHGTPDFTTYEKGRVPVI
jgi:hypothetical protein